MVVNFPAKLSILSCWSAMNSWCLVLDFELTRYWTSFVIWWDFHRKTIMEGYPAENGYWMEGLTRGFLLLWLLVRNPDWETWIETWWRHYTWTSVVHMITLFTCEHCQDVLLDKVAQLNWACTCIDLVNWRPGNVMNCFVTTHASTACLPSRGSASYLSVL